MIYFASISFAHRVCRFGADCKVTNSKRALAVSTIESESVATTDLGRAANEGEGSSEAGDAAMVNGAGGIG